MQNVRTALDLVRKAGLVVPFVVLGLGANTAAQSTCGLGPSAPSDLPDPGEVYILNSVGTKWISTDMDTLTLTLQTPKTYTFTRDPRPVVWAQLWNPGSTPAGGWPTDNPTRIYWSDTADTNGNSVADGVDAVIDQLDFLYSEGWRRIHLRLPGGRIATEQVGTPTWEDNKMNMQQWWHLPQSLRDDFTKQIGNWVTVNTDAELGVYIGRRVNVAWNPCVSNGEVDLNGDCYDCTDTANWIDADPANPGFDWGWLGGAARADVRDRDYMENLYLNVMPWIDMGIEEIHFDNFSSTATTPTAWSEFQNLVTSPDWYTYKFGAEALTTDGGAGGTPWRDTELTIAPLSCTTNFFANQGYVNDTSVPAGRTINVTYPNPDEPAGGWTGDPETELVVILFDQGSSVEKEPATWNSADYHDLAVSEYVLGTRVAGLGMSLTADVESIQRKIQNVYDWPLVALDNCERADINGDGTVDNTDLLLILDLTSGTLSRDALPGPWQPSGAFNDGYGIYHGDINDDGVVNSSDYFAWVTAVTGC